MKRANVIAFTSACLSLLFVSGCVEKSTGLTDAERERVSPFVSTEAPSPQHELNVSFENKIELLGYDVSATELREGQSFEVTWYWHCSRPLEEDWRAFTHLTDARGGDRINQDNVGVVREVYWPGRWKAGEYIRDVQNITLPEDWGSDKVTLHLGIWNGPHRLQVTEGPNDGDNRVPALELPVAVSATAPAPTPTLPSLTATRVTSPITIDGKLDEAAWGTTASTERFVNTMNGGAAEPETTAKVLWDDENIYVAFAVKDDHLRSSFTERDEHLWEQDTVEIMVDPDGDGRNYFELQVSPNGVTFETRYDTQRQPQPFGHVDWNPELEAAADVSGTVGDDEADSGYTVEVAIPFASFVNGDAPGETPEVGGTYRMNFFVMDARSGDEGMRAAGWSPPRVGDFHTLNRFGNVRFADESGALPAAAAAPAGPVPGLGPAMPRLELPGSLRRQARPGERPLPGTPRASRDVGMGASPMTASPMTASPMAASPMTASPMTASPTAAE